MKKIVLFLYVSLVSQISCAGNQYYMEQLINSPDKYKASPEVQKFMAAYTGNDFIDCQKQLNESSINMSHYFLSTPISINSAGTTTLLVFPSKYCYAFFGAHSVQFWLLENKKIILSARQDGFEIMPSITNGYSDIKLLYGIDSVISKYNGKIYVPKE